MPSAFEPQPRPAPAFAVSQWLRETPAVLWVILGLCVLPEAVLQGADLGLWGAASWRASAYAWGGFWPGLLYNWRPNYPAQPWLMFISYGFLHGGAMHLVVNMMTLFSLGRPIIARIGSFRFVLLYVLSLLGGGAGFGLLSESTSPMVGASGALFGLAGAWVAWDYLDRFTGNRGLWPVLQMVIWLILLNLILWWSMQGALAWQTHLGGFVAGWIAAWILDPRART